MVGAMETPEMLATVMTLSLKKILSALTQKKAWADLTT